MAPPTLIPIGSDVILWTRTADNVILLLGEGRYEEDNYFNGNQYPVVKFNDGRELTVHYQGISMGRREAVAATCKTFKGTVLAWDIEDYIAGKRPAKQDTYSAQQGNSTLPTNGEPLPEPKTMTDKLMRLKSEIDYEESKKKMASEMIAIADKNIAAKRQEMANIKSAVLAELAAVDGIVAEPVVAKAAPVVTPALPQTIVIDRPQQDSFDDEARRNALND